jgi:hypothetical protein
MTTTSGVDMMKLKRFVAIDKQLDELDRLTKSLKLESAEIEAGLRDQFMQVGVQSLNIDGKTVYLNGTWRVSAANGAEGGPDWARACRAMVEAGFGQYVEERFNLNSVGALVRGFDRDPQTLEPILPEPLREALVLRNDTKLRVVAARGRGGRERPATSNED